MTDQLDISGDAPARFDGVREAFAANFRDGLEIGARFTVIQAGETLVDLWAGLADRTQKTPWTAETLACIYSSGKAVCAGLVAACVEAGHLDYDRPLSDYWPDFAEAGKGTVRLGQALSHQAGVCAFLNEIPAMDWLDPSAMARRVAAAAPLWPPGTASGYHAQTYGVIAGEVVRRATGKTIGAHLRARYEQDAADDLHCGFSGAPAARAAMMTKPSRPPDLGPLNDYKRAAFLKPWSSAPAKPVETWRAAEMPASNMHGTALALARALQPLAGAGGLAPATVAAALRPRISGPDLVLPFHLTWAAGLFANPEGAFGPDPDVWGHAGFGGSCVIVDPARRLSAAYVMNKMSPSLLGDPRPRRLLWALYDAL